MKTSRGNDPSVLVLSSRPSLTCLIRSRYPDAQRISEVRRPLRDSDVLLLDASFDMPAVERALAAVRQQSPRCRIFLLSAKKSIDLEACLGVGVEDYLPFGFAQLPDFPDLLSGSFLGDLKLCAGNNERRAHLLKITWSKLRAYLRHREDSEQSIKRETGIAMGLGGRETGTALGFGSDVIGNMLEDFVICLLRSVDGFECHKGKLGGKGQMDILVRNESTDGFWLKAGLYFAVECKNHAINVPGEVVDKLVSFARRSSGTIRMVMLFHTAAQLTAGAQSRLLAEGLGSIIFLEMNRQRVFDLMNDAPLEQPAELPKFISKKLKEAISDYVLACDFNS